MPFSWSDIRANAQRFAHDWAGVTSERAEAQTFWNEWSSDGERVAFLFELYQRLTSLPATVPG